MRHQRMYRGLRQPDGTHHRLPGQIAGWALIVGLAWLGCWVIWQWHPLAGLLVFRP